MTSDFQQAVSVLPTTQQTSSRPTPVDRVVVVCSMPNVQRTLKRCAKPFPLGMPAHSQRRGLSL